MSEPRRGQLTALILAGQREGRVDAFAAEMGQTYKCLVPVAGEPMILHVVRSLAACEEVGDILISANAAASLEDLPPIAALIAAGGLQILPAKPNLVDSVMAALAGRRFPVLVTTADNVLLSPHAVAELHDRAQVAEADIAVAFARRQSVLAAHSDGQRRFYRFADDAYSNCNSYWLGSAQALRPVEIFRQGGQFAKHPWRIVQAFGLLNLLLLLTHRLSLHGAARRISRRFNVALAAVVLADGSQAIDVDNLRSHGIAELLLTERAPQAEAA